MNNGIQNHNRIIYTPKNRSDKGIYIATEENLKAIFDMVNTIVEIIRFNSQNNNMRQ